MKAIFTQVIVIAVLCLVLVGVFFYKTSRANGTDPGSWQGTTVSVKAEVPKEEKIEVVKQSPQAPPQALQAPQSKGHHHAQQIKHQPQHGFFWRLIHPRSWKIFQHHKKTP